MSTIKYKCELKIENFPSRYELFKELERFLRIRHYDVRYQTINKSNLMIIYSDSPDTILGFAELLKKKKQMFLIIKIWLLMFLFQIKIV